MNTERNTERNTQINTEKNKKEIFNMIQEMITSIEMIATIEYFNENKRRKSISFKNENEEFLIIDRNYIMENDLRKELWYSFQEMEEFKQNAIMDIQLFMMINPGYTSKDAMRIMWVGDV